MSSPSEPRPAWRRRRWWWLAAGLAIVLVVGGVIAVVVVRRGQQPTAVPLGLRPAGEVALPGDSSRFDYASLDAGRGLLFIAHLGASEVVEVDVHAQRVLRTIGGLPGVHGVIVVPDKHRVYATATNANRMVVIDEDTGVQLASGPTGAYPDGLAYDPVRHEVWTTNESGGSETVLNADTASARATVPLGGEVGNVVYDATTRMMMVDVQSDNVLAVVDPATLAVTRRLPLPGCDHDHGLAIDSSHRLAFVACDGNATLLTVDLTSWQVVDHLQVGQDPDVLAFDAAAQRLYVAAESGWLSILIESDRHLSVAGSSHLADGAHVVAVDPGTHRSYYPIPSGSTGRPALLLYDPA
jgi:DNA-binding beta-propeller fold protein YncE